MITVEVKIHNEEAHQISFHKNKIYIGGHPQSDIFLPNRGLLAFHIMIEIINARVIIRPGPKVDFFHVDGKRAVARQYFKPNQVLKIKNVELRLISYQEDPLYSRREKLNHATDKILQDDAELRSIIQDFQREISS